MSYYEMVEQLATLESTVIETVKQIREELWHREYDRFLDRSIDELELSVRTYNCLKNAEIYTIRKLITYSPKELKKFRNFGKRSVDEVRQVLHSFGPDLDLRDAD